MGEDIGYEMVEQLSVTHLSEFMRPTMERTTYYLTYLYPILKRADPHLHKFISEWVWHDLRWYLCVILFWTLFTLFHFPFPHVWYSNNCSCYTVLPLIILMGQSINLISFPALVLVQCSAYHGWLPGLLTHSQTTVMLYGSMTFSWPHPILCPCTLLQPLSYRGKRMWWLVNVIWQCNTSFFLRLVIEYPLPLCTK